MREALDLFRKAVQERFVGVENKLASLLGWQLQDQYAKHIYAYFGDIMHKLRLLTPSDIDDLVRPVLSSVEVKDLFLADIVAQGRLPNQPEQQVYLVVKVSHKVEEGDVARARRRADLLRRAGVPCLAVVGGQEITDGALLEAKHSKVLCTLDGSLQKGWQEIFTRSLQTDSA